jgi:hypothetical protein
MLIKEPFVRCACGEDFSLEELAQGYDLGFNDIGDTATFTCPQCDKNLTTNIRLRDK